MKKGDVIGGYVLTTDPRGGGGHSEWAFARKDGEDFFIKRFLLPTFPLPDSPGSERTKAVKRARCQEFERHQRLVMRKLRPISGEGGNLIITKEFFRDRAHYYKVTTRVDVSDIGPRHIAAMPRDDRIFIMLTAAKSLDTLHKAGLVHGDVKPENLLIKALDKGRFAVKVIDFDNCFPVHHPPVADQLVGDPAYYSPELLLYNVGGAAGDQLNEKSDVFALGLVFWLYLAGARPALPAGMVYPAEAVQAGTALTLPRSAKDRPLAELVHSMLAKASADRPSMGEVHSSLKLARRSMPDGKSSRPSPSRPAKPIRARLGGGLLRRLPVAASGFAGPEVAEPPRPAIDEPSAADAPAADAPDEAAAPRLRGKLIKKAAPGDGAKGETTEGRLRGSLIKRKE